MSGLPGQVVLINAFDVAEGLEEEFECGWEATRDYLKTQPGYVDIALHEAVSPTPQFRFVNMTRWESAEAVQAAIESADFREVSRALADFTPRAGLYRVIRT